MIGSQPDPLTHLLTTAAMFIEGAALATLSTVMFPQVARTAFDVGAAGVLLGPLLWPFDQTAAAFAAGTTLLATSTRARWHHDASSTAPTPLQIWHS